MPIIDTELKFYKSLVVSDGTTNGGRMSANQIASASAGNLFAAVGQSERTAGSTKYRKLFAKVGNTSNLTLFNPKVYLDKYTPGDDRISFFPATQTDIQSAITGSERQYGSGKLNADKAAGQTTCDVLVELAAAIIFVNGDTVRITDKATIADAGNEEYLVISGVPTFTGNVCHLAFTSALQNSYLAATTRVMPVYFPPADIVPSADAEVTTTGASGTFDITKVTVDEVGGIYQTWTLTFTTATAYNIVGDTVGSVGSGNTGGGATPNNASFTRPYFTIDPSAFGGTFQAADTVVFVSHPSAVALWMKRVVPAAAAALANNTATIVLDGETAG